MMYILREVEYPQPPDMVWQALTDSDLLTRAFAPNDLRPEVGHVFQFRARPAPGFDGIINCQVLEVEPGRRLRYTWQGSRMPAPTMLTWQIEPTNHGTRVRLEHTGFEGVEGRFLAALHGLGWSRFLNTSLPELLPTLRDG